MPTPIQVSQITDSLRLAKRAAREGDMIACAQYTERAEQQFAKYTAFLRQYADEQMTRLVQSMEPEN